MLLDPTGRKRCLRMYFRPRMTLTFALHSSFCDTMGIYRYVPAKFGKNLLDSS